ncbi:MAG: DUF2171 domain-containing protein [Oscillochloris sp.]|nr:DUF2171 domain-containing protein [Oscillochloris sp.]
MSEEPFVRAHDRSILNDIHEGMTVYDRSGDKIGTVEFVHFGTEGTDVSGASSPAAAGRDRGSFVDQIASTLWGSDNLPDTVQARLNNSGFIRMDAKGLFAKDRYITPDQITAVDEAVHLGATRDELTKTQ